MDISIRNQNEHDAEPMLEDIRRQPDTLGSICARRSEIGDFAAENLEPGKDGQTYVFGSGDGWFAARAALGGITGIQARSGLDFTLDVAPSAGPNDRALAISMSGNVDRTVEGATLAKDRGALLSVLTNGGGGRLGALNGPLYSLDIPDIAPFLCGTSTYTATLAMLQIAFGGNKFADGLDRLLPALPAFIEEADRFAHSVAARIGHCAGIRILGVGSSVATADYGAAKFVEVTRIPAWSDDIEEFAHRQYWGMQVAEAVVLLPVDAASARYADATADALSDLDVQTMALEPQNAKVPTASSRLSLPGGSETAAITQAIALQLLAYHFGVASGTNPNRREHLKNDQARFSVSRKLTRRSLLGTGQ
jgi:glucosamine 6-phosphate synthetase-like amidotransferase/phosphosugar isomerase protein